MMKVSAAVLLTVCMVFSLNTQAGQSGAADESLLSGSVLETLGAQHSVRLFYLPEWFQDVTIDPSIAMMPLPEALRTIGSAAGLATVHIDDLIVFLPAADHADDLPRHHDGHLTIGDPSQYGRYRRATISGVVRDGARGTSLVGAVVYDQESETGASADTEGFFELELPVGRRNLRFSYMGYDDMSRTVTLISDGWMTADLFSETTQLDEVTVLAQRAQDNFLRTQMGMVTMDAQTLEELPGSFGEQDIVRSMTLLPGVQSVGEFGAGINVRGGSADQNLLLVEGVPLFNASHLFGLISVINPEMVGNVTLMKAGIPARYGERASSVMDVRLRNQTEKKETSLKGGIGLINSRVLLETPLLTENVNFSLGARSSYSDFFLHQIPNEDLMNSSARFYDLTAHATMTPNPDNYLSIFGYHSFDRFGFLGENNYEYNSTMASVRWNRLINVALSRTLVAGWSRYAHQYAEMPELNRAQHAVMQSEIDYKSLRYHFSYYPSYNHSLEFGINAIHYNMEPGKMSPLGDESTIEQAALDDEQALELSAFISDHVFVGDNISMELGLRYTQYLQLGPATVNQYEADKPRSEESVVEQRTYNKYDVVSRYGGLEPRVGLRYATGESGSLKASYHRMNQYINLISNTSVMSPADTWKLSDQHIRPLRSDQYSVGYFRNFQENTIVGSLELYYRDYQDVTEYKSGAEIAMNDMLEADVISAKGYGYGMEIYLRKITGRLTGWTSYTYSSSMRRSQERFPELQINDNNYFPSNHDRPHSLVFNLHYDISRRWRLGAVFTYNTGRPVTLPELIYRYQDDFLIYYSERNKYRLPDYHRLDISLTFGENLRLDQRGKGSWTFSLMNVYGRKNPHAVYYKRTPSSSDSPRSFHLYQLYIVGRPLPTITYNFSF